MLNEVGFNGAEHVYFTERYVEPEPEIYEEKIVEEEDIGDDSWNDYHGKHNQRKF